MSVSQCHQIVKTFNIRNRIWLVKKNFSHDAHDAHDACGTAYVAKDAVDSSVVSRRSSARSKSFY